MHLLGEAHAHQQIKQRLTVGEQEVKANIKPLSADGKDTIKSTTTALSTRIAIYLAYRAVLSLL